MKAQSDHVIVRLPSSKQQTDSGILLNPVEQKQIYGRIVSIGPGAAEHIDANEGDIVVFETAGAAPLQVNPLSSQTDLLAMHYSQVFATVDDGYLESQKLPVPASDPAA